MKVYILRGVSGSGKSTFTKKIKNSVVFSTDNFFYKNKKYKFDLKKLKEFHLRNFEEFKNSLKKRKRNIIVDNTNLIYKYVRPYIDEAKKEGYKVILVDFVPRGREYHFKRNIHNIPKRVISNQLKNYYNKKEFKNFDKVIRILS